ncbi:transcriptional regulator NrdR [Anoxybacter fermentans]|uniref:Transcriptional repressor NrdR n=1 Tax=Anoxybacter fermentans TaxID=1323375 RepID=A0A3Q9HQ96_9FIRM|nr:transcriptional regulator NrdR [Anoxybacter fermentans]AZR73025.1 transcriptional regulator NrdR [Anoxybacter fermentans]
MKCPYCNYNESKVVDSRSTEENTSIRRRRECLKCGERFTTYERIEELPLMVIKKGGSQEFFDRNKLLTGILKACEKRPIPRKVLEDLVKDIERELRNRMETEVKSEEIGEMVMERLKNVDEVAYVRFASVYRQFKDINIFKQELEKLLES